MLTKRANRELLVALWSGSYRFEVESTPKNRAGQPTRRVRALKNEEDWCDA